MRPTIRVSTVILLLYAFPVLGPRELRAQSPIQIQRSIANYLQQEMQQGHIVGAQVFVSGPRMTTTRPVNLGTLGPDLAEPVTDETVFCIASCSKPIASAVVFTLLDQNKLQLEMPIGKLIPELAAPRTVAGQSTRSPTLRELLIHRSGVYSQHERPTPDQVSAIRDFTQSLDDSVAKIAVQPLTSVPGTQYAYSGAGYCLVGRMAELATQTDFETLLQENLCEPAQMKSTSYFPIQAGFKQIASGGQGAKPHRLGSAHKFPLIGGSLYTNVTDLNRFTTMVLSTGRIENQQVLSAKAASYFISPAHPKQAYGYGWRLTQRRNVVTIAQHKGSLPPYQSAIQINLEHKVSKIVLWTLANPNNVAATKRISNQIDTLFNGGAIK